MAKNNQLSINAVLMLLQKQKGKCYYCKKDLLELAFYPKSLTQDHILAKSKGGTEHINNKCICCLHCNFGKSHTPVKQFAKHLQWLMDAKKKYYKKKKWFNLI